MTAKVQIYVNGTVAAEGETMKEAIDSLFGVVGLRLPQPRYSVLKSWSADLAAGNVPTKDDVWTLAGPGEIVAKFPSREWAERICELLNRAEEK